MMLFFFSLSASSTIKPAATASEKILLCLPKGFVTIEYTINTVQINNTANIIPRKIFYF
ncbi:hypothetical protein [Clostridium massiliamazoniense]|uniref:hypothetical protein n=1 Tax=Clostridium massiliamazoniense TaxID=1347366 RepID=UPI000A951A51|nr:hypothetical protein [Clostridium massiliamazoniense]